MPEPIRPVKGTSTAAVVQVPSHPPHWKVVYGDQWGRPEPTQRKRAMPAMPRERAAYGLHGWRRKRFHDHSAERRGRA